MYIPAAFEIHDEARLFDFVEQYSFATLVSILDTGPFATHLPLLLDRAGRMLLGHVARGNPHWKSLDGIAQTLAIFQGPHAYISPTTYTTSPAVPTWNYAAVHISGRARTVTEARLEEIIDRLVQKYEAGRRQPWDYVLPGDFKSKLLPAIVGFELPIERIEGKFKLGQNRPEVDQQSMLAQLNAGNSAENELARFIQSQPDSSDRT